MQLIASSVLVSNQGPDKCGFEEIKKANPKARIHLSVLWLQSNIQTIFRSDIYRFVGDNKGFRTAKKSLLAEIKTGKKKAGPNDPALIEENCDGLVYQGKCM